MQLLDLPFTRMLGVDTDPSIKRPRRVLQQLLLPGINLVRVNLVARRQLSHRRLLPQRLQGAPPGKQLQIDFGERRALIGGESVKVYLFVATLGYSRRLYVRAFRNERQEKLVRRAG